MTFNRDEYGSILRVNLGVDLGGRRIIKKILQPERGEKGEYTANVAVGTSNIVVDDSEFLANQYLEYTIQPDDLDKEGLWRARGSSIVSGELIKSDYVRFTVLP
jgi:hypothetical protein